MTHTEISNLAGNRLVELNNMYLHDAVNSCLSEPVNVSNIGDVVSEITNRFLRNAKVIYFAESTVAKNVDPEKRARNRLKNGFNVGGMNIGIDKVPIWKDFNSESRNVRYKLHSWVMLDSLLTADEVSNSD